MSIKILSEIALILCLVTSTFSMTPKNTNVTFDSTKEHIEIMRTIEKSNTKKTEKKIVIVNAQAGK